MTNNSYQTIPFGDVVTQGRESEKNPLEAGFERYIGLEHLDPESLKIRRWGYIEEDNPSFTRVFRAGQVLFGRRRAYQRKAALAEFDGICSGDIIVMEAIPGKLLPKLLPFLVQTEGFYDYALQTSAGSLSPRTKWSALAKCEFPLPPLDEQQRIAELLWAVEENIRNFQRCEELALIARARLLEQFLGENSSDGTLVELGTVLLGTPESGYSPNSVDRETGHYVLALSALSKSGYQRGHLKAVDLIPEVDATRLQNGDFLISRSNTHELVALVGIYDEDRDNVSFPDTIMRLPVDDTQVRRTYLEQYLLSLEGRKQLRRIAAGTSGSMKKINKRNLINVPILLLPLGVQDHILEHLEIFDKALQDLKHHVTNSELLKKKLLDDLLCSEYQLNV